MYHFRHAVHDGGDGINIHATTLRDLGEQYGFRHGVLRISVEGGIGRDPGTLKILALTPPGRGI